MVGLARNVTAVPAHTGLDDAVINMLTAWFGMTVMVTGLEVAGFPLAHKASDVRIHVITSPFKGIYDIVGAYCETPIPLTNH